MKKINQLRIFWILEIIIFILILTFSIEADKFTLSMMNAKNSITFGLGVSLFISVNIVASYLVYKLIKSTQKRLSKY